MRKFKRLTMTLALLIMAVGGAWAQSSPNVVEFEVPAEWEDEYSPVTAADLPGFYTSTLEEAQKWTGAPAEGYAYLIYAFDGDNNAYHISFENGKSDAIDYPISKAGVFQKKSIIKIYYTIEPTEWSLTPDETGKTWTLDKMPASNIELQVEYFAESNLFLSKDALADKANIDVTAGELGVQFGDDGKSANTITEGTPMTVTYNGTKKVIGMTVEKVEAVDPANAYLTWDADQKKLVATEIPAEAIKVENSTSYVEWSGTYVVEGNVTISGQITLSGNVNLIIKDGATLTAQGGIRGYNNNLYIYGQANQTGQLVVDKSDDDAITSMKTLEVHSAKVTATSSKKDRGGFYYTGTINVYGGSVDATAANGYGISLRSDGSINIYGGEVKAVGKGTGGYSYGITAGNTSTVTVNGGKLWAENADKKAINTSLITLKKGAGFTGKIEYSSDKSTWSETVDANAKYVRAGY